VVRIDPRESARAPDLHAAGAGDVWLRDGSAPTDSGAAELLDRLARLIRGPRAIPRKNTGPAGIIGASPEMAQVFSLAAVASTARATVLISGETGTGKELIAREIHRGSERAERPFVALNCAALPDTLLESELFGHERGSFTGAERDKRGLFEAAHRGTLFLDEVGETSAMLQAKLLRVLEQREVRPVGATRTRPVDVRIVAATNRDLWREANAGRFREDLYYRLAVFPIHLPPLRERPGDLLALAEHFLATHGRAESKPDVVLSPEAIRLLQAHRWPGNVRELENEIQRALALSRPGETLTPLHFSERLSTILEPIDAAVQPGESLRDTLGRIEAWLIRRSLDAHHGRRAETARQLGVTREGLYKKMKRLRIE
jgi:transcriptional regulator with PAS, ATPase and Fis domain